jgi:hypothetical protein
MSQSNESIANYLEKWYEGGRVGLSRISEASSLEEAQALCDRWFKMGDRRVHKVLRLLREADLGSFEEVINDDPQLNLTLSPQAAQDDDL